MSNQATISSTTQSFLDIYDITNDVLILKDGSTAMILTVNAMNFGLLAEEEQDAIIYAYAGLLNSLNYPIQIVIRSQTKDVTNYLQLLKDEEDQTTSDVKRAWIRKYREFVADLIQERNVLDKKFYVVVPASALEMGLLPASTVLPGVKQPDLSTIERSVILDKAKEILEPKRDHILGQFGRIGLVARQLATQEIIQLFYVSYNPEAAEGQQITDTNSYTTPLVGASVQGGFMSDQTTPMTNSVVTPPQPGPMPVGPVPMAAPAETPVMTPPQVGPVGTPTMTPPAAAQPPVMAPAQPAMSQPPAMPSMMPPVATPGLPESPAITPPAAPQNPPMAPTPAVGADQIQQEINSTLKELGGVDLSGMGAGSVPPSGSAGAGMTPPPAVGVDGKPVTEI